MKCKHLLPQQSPCSAMRPQGHIDTVPALWDNLYLRGKIEMKKEKTVTHALIQKSHSLISTQLG